MTTYECKEKFHEFSHHASMILPIEEERVQLFHHLLRFYQWIDDESMVSAVCFF